MSSRSKVPPARSILAAQTPEGGGAAARRFRRCYAFYSECHVQRRDRIAGFLYDLQEGGQLTGGHGFSPGAEDLLRANGRDLSVPHRIVTFVTWADGAHVVSPLVDMTDRFQPG